MRDRGSNCKQLKMAASAKTANRIKPAQSKPEKPATLSTGNNNLKINKNLQQTFPIFGMRLLPKQQICPAFGKARGKKCTGYTAESGL